jgi:hypothetical protein
MRRDVLHMNQPQIRCTGDHIAQMGDRCEAASREDIPLDEIHVTNVPAIPLVFDRNRLQGHDTVWFEKMAAGAEECLYERMSDGFDHFD